MEFSLCFCCVNSNSFPSFVLVKLYPLLKYIEMELTSPLFFQWAQTSLAGNIDSCLSIERGKFLSLLCRLLTLFPFETLKYSLQFSVLKHSRASFFFFFYLNLESNFLNYKLFSNILRHSSSFIAHFLIYGKLAFPIK